jgi:hypothetical protein
MSWSGNAVRPGATPAPAPPPARRRPRPAPGRRCEPLAPEQRSCGRSSHPRPPVRTRQARPAPWRHRPGNPRPAPATPQGPAAPSPDHAPHPAAATAQAPQTGLHPTQWHGSSPPAEPRRPATPPLSHARVEADPRIPPSKLHPGSAPHPARSGPSTSPIVPGQEHFPGHGTQQDHARFRLAGEPVALRDHPERTSPSRSTVATSATADRAPRPWLCVAYAHLCA